MPDYIVTSPQGKKYRITAPEGATQDQVLAYAQKQFAEPQAPQGEGSALAGTVQGALNVGAHAVETPIVGLAGLAGMVKGALTPGETAANQSQAYMQGMQAALDKPVVTVGTPDNGLKTQAADYAVQKATGDVMGAIPNGLQYLYGKSRQSVANGPLGKFNTGADEARQEARDTTFLNIAGNSLPLLAGMRTAEKAPAAAVEETPLVAAQKLGYRIMPSEAATKGGAAPIGKMVEGLAGSAKTGVSAVLKNQPVTNALAAKEIGAPTSELTSTILDQLRAKHNAVYKEVAGVGEIPTDSAYLSDVQSIGRTPGESFPGAENAAIAKLKEAYSVPVFDSADAVLHIRKLRAAANKNIKAPFDPEKNDLGYAQKDVADAIESQIERHIYSQTSGVSDLLPRFRSARQSLAKINTVDHAIKEGTTDVSAQDLAKQLNKGAPLSGNLKAIAEAANNFPISIRDATKVRNKVPINALEGLMGGVSLPASVIMHEPHLAVAGLTGMAARPLARAGLLSKPYQAAMVPNPLLSPEMSALLPRIGTASALVGNQPNLLQLLQQQ
jgi:hypothetical protein